MTPRSVVPAVATTAIGVSDCASRSATTRRRAGTDSIPRSSTGTGTTQSSSRPSTCAAVTTEKWLSALARIRNDAARTGRGAAPGTSAERSRHSSRASIRACRLEVVPPGVNMPSAPSGKPMRPAVHASSCRSMTVAALDWSHVSRDTLTAAASVSAATAGTATGQLRWARVRGWWNHTAWRSHVRSSSSTAASKSGRGESRSTCARSAAIWAWVAGSWGCSAEAMRAAPAAAAVVTSLTRSATVSWCSRGELMKRGFFPWGALVRRNRIRIGILFHDRLG